MSLIEGLGDRILKSVPLPKLIIVVLQLIPLLQVQVIIREEMVVILGSYHLILHLALDILVRGEVVRAILFELVVVALVVEVLPCTLVCLPVVLDGPVEACCLQFSGLAAFVGQGLGVDL